MATSDDAAARGVSVSGALHAARAVEATSAATRRGACAQYRIGPPGPRVVHHGRAGSCMRARWTVSACISRVWHLASSALVEAVVFSLRSTCSVLATH